MRSWDGEVFLEEDVEFAQTSILLCIDVQVVSSFRLLQVVLLTFLNMSLANIGPYSRGMDAWNSGSDISRLAVTINFPSGCTK